MRNRITFVAGCVGLAAGAACGQGTIRSLGTGIEVSPERIVPIVLEADGSVRRIGEWLPFAQAAGVRACDELRMVFDAVRPTGTCNNGLLFFGTGYCAAVFMTNDMELAPETDPDAGLRRMDFAWYWTCGGFASERCLVATFTQDSAPCEANSFDYTGWLLDFGDLPCNPGGYYLAEVDLGRAGGSWAVPTGGAGSYSLTFAREMTADGALIPATCTQPMLWGTGEARGDPEAPGRQGPFQLDDVDGDGVHDPDDECFDYTFTGACPPVLGAAAGFWQENCTDLDINGDGTVDALDVTAFLNAWSAGEDAADWDGNGEVDTRDLTCFLNSWVACR
jgi:hypothetical protein